MYVICTVPEIKVLIQENPFLVLGFPSIFPEAS